MTGAEDGSGGRFAGQRPPPGPVVTVAQHSWLTGAAAGRRVVTMAHHLFLALMVAAPVAAQRSMAAEDTRVTVRQQQPRIYGHYRAGLALRANPLGFFLSSAITARLRLYQSDKLALKDNFVSGGLTGFATPAFARIGALVEVQPLTVLQLFASYELLAIFRQLRVHAVLPIGRGGQLRRRAAPVA